MAGTFGQIASRALDLSPRERYNVAMALFESVDDNEAGVAEAPAEIEAAWEEEIARRVADLDSGRVEPVPAEVVVARVRERLAQIRAGKIPEVLETAMELPPQDRIDLANLLLDTVEDDDADGAPAEVDAAWATEIKRRVDEIRSGTAVTYDGDEVMAELRERFG